MLKLKSNAESSALIRSIIHARVSKVKKYQKSIIVHYSESPSDEYIAINLQADIDYIDYLRQRWDQGRRPARYSTDTSILKLFFTFIVTS